MGPLWRQISPQASPTRASPAHGPSPFALERSSPSTSPFKMDQSEHASSAAPSQTLDFGPTSFYASTGEGAEAEKKSGAAHGQLFSPPPKSFQATVLSPEAGYLGRLASGHSPSVRSPKPGSHSPYTLMMTSNLEHRHSSEVSPFSSGLQGYATAHAADAAAAGADGVQGVEAASESAGGHMPIPDAEAPAMLDVGDLNQVLDR